MHTDRQTNGTILLIFFAGLQTRLIDIYINTFIQLTISIILINFSYCIWDLRFSRRWDFTLLSFELWHRAVLLVDQSLSPLPQVSKSFRRNDGVRFLRNVCNHQQDYMVSQHRRSQVYTWASCCEKLSKILLYCCVETDKNIILDRRSDNLYILSVLFLIGLQINT
jgi:hypothetical protein